MPLQHRRWAAEGTALVVPALVVLALLSGCTRAHDSPTVAAPVAPPSAAAAPSAGAVPSPSVAAAPSAVARELAAFDAANRATIAGTSRPGGRAFVDGLVAAGFSRKAMQVTEDRTTIGAAVPSVQFSVLWRGVCLLGQYGPESGGYHGVTADPVSGRCLLGKTRPIDW